MNKHMKQDKLARKSKRLSWLLRFGAADEGLDVHPAGWVSLDAVLGLLNMRAAEVEAVVGGNNKRRFEIDGRRIRASQGHGGTMPVTREALESTWRRVESDAVIYHGTGIGALDGIAASGILPSARTHVHLASTTDSRVGKRAGVAVLLEVSPVLLRETGREIFESPNGVILVRDVPPECIVELRCLTRRAVTFEPTLRALFSLPSG